MSGKFFVGNTSNIATLPKDILVGDQNNIARKVKEIYIGNSQNQAVKVWPSQIIPDIFTQLNWIYFDHYARFSIGTDINTSIQPRIQLDFSFPEDINSHTYGENCFFSGTRFSAGDSGTTIVNAWNFSTGTTSLSYSAHIQRINGEYWFIFKYNLPHYSSPYTYGYYQSPDVYRTGSYCVKTYVGSVSSNARFTLDFNYITNNISNTYISCNEGYYSTSSNQLVTSGNKIDTSSIGNLFVDFKIALFGCYNLSLDHTSPYNMMIKFYHCKIYDNNNSQKILRDYFPCYRNSDKILGLYDNENKVFYPSNAYTTTDGIQYG